MKFPSGAVYAVQLMSYFRGLLDKLLRNRAAFSALLRALAPSGGRREQGGELAGPVVMVKHFPRAHWREQERRRMCRRPVRELLPPAVSQQVRWRFVHCRPFAFKVYVTLIPHAHLSRDVTFHSFEHRQESGCL